MSLIIKARVSTVGKKAPVQSSTLESKDKFSFRKGELLECDSVSESGSSHYLAKTAIDDKFWYFYKSHVIIINKNIITKEQFTKAFFKAKQANIDKYFQPIIEALNDYEINTPQRIAAFFAQLAHESAHLNYSEEIASGRAYEGRKDLGNVYQGDGVKYKGRGLIQLTGRANYRWLSKELGIDLIKNPQIAANNPVISARIAAIYWKSKQLNKYADKGTEKGLRAITRKINGGYNGWDDRLSNWKRISKIFSA